jgi:hypothetical protein
MHICSSITFFSFPFLKRTTTALHSFFSRMSSQKRSKEVKSVWVLSVNNLDMLNAIAVFEKPQDAIEFVKCKGLELLQKTSMDETIYTTIISMAEDTKQTLFESYNTKWNSHFKKYTLWLHKRKLGEQFVSAHHECIDIEENSTRAKSIGL